MQCMQLDTCYVSAGLPACQAQLLAISEANAVTAATAERKRQGCTHTDAHRHL